MNDGTYLLASACINLPMVWVHFYFSRLLKPEQRMGVTVFVAYVLLSVVNTFWFVYSRSLYFYSFTNVLYASYAVYLAVFFRFSGKESVFYTYIFYFLTHFWVRSVPWLGIWLGIGSALSPGTPLWCAVPGALSISVLSFGTVWLFRKQLRMLQGYRMSVREFINGMFLAVPLGYFCHSEYLMTVDYLHLPPEMILMRMAVSLGSVYALVGTLVVNKSRSEQLEVARMEALLESQYEQFRVKREVSEQVMAKCHDLQKQMRMAAATQQPEYMEQYQQELQKTIDDYDSLYETGNATIDTLLSDAGLNCRKDGVQLICLLDGRDFDFISPMDLCTIFGNALDNAIESVCRIAEPEKRIIHVKSSADKGVLILRVDNYYGHELHWDNGELRTSKGEGTGHGYGLKSIRFAVEKYGGHVQTQAEDGRFVLTISLPI